MGKFAQLYLKESADVRPDAAMLHHEVSKVQDGNKFNRHEAKVLKTGKASSDHHEVAGPKAYRVSKYKNGKYLGPDHDHHTDDQHEAIEHAKSHVAHSDKTDNHANIGATVGVS